SPSARLRRSRACWNRGRALPYSPIAWYSAARLFRLAARRGGASGSTRLLRSRACAHRGRALPYSPRARYSPARLVRLLARQGEGALAQRPFAQVRGLLVQGQGLAVLPQGPVQHGQVVQAGGVEGVGLAQHPLAQVAGLLEQGQGLAVLAPVLV